MWLNACREEMNEFKSFIWKIGPILKAMQEQTKQMVPVKDLQNKNYQKFLEMLGKYEETNMSVYTNHQASWFIVSDVINKDMK